jgi:uncharacterized iron-regulated protein
MKNNKLFVPLAALAMMSACTDAPFAGTDAAKEAALREVAEQYIDRVVVPTYKALADTSKLLYEALTALKDAKTQENAQQAALMWKRSRAWWEMSEAFLFGPASDFSIDPHIDTWPIAQGDLQSELDNTSHITSMSEEDGDAWVGEHLGGGLYGFHGIEYILFRNGSVRAVDDITESELIYAVAVAGDMRNQCYRLEAAWAGIDNVDSDKKSKLEDLELSYTISSKRRSYGENMLLAGKTGSTYISFADAMLDISGGCSSIADEVGNMKIGRPYDGNDPNYIESPFAHNSKQDFIDNIRSIENVYYGGVNTAERAASLRNWVNGQNPALNAEVEAAIADAISKIDAIGNKFEDNISNSKCQDAIDACDAIVKAFEKVDVLLKE